MSGKGVDAFIEGCYMGNLLTTSEGGMFPYPEKAMKNKLFLPLDNYIKDAQLIDRELHNIFVDHDTGRSLQRSVYKHYVTMLMMLAES